MPTHWNYVDSPRRTVRVLSATEVIDVQQVDFETVPSGVRATAYVPYPQWLAQKAATTVAPIAIAIEDAISGGLATGGWGYEDTDAQGLIVDGVTFVVSYTNATSGAISQTTVDVPYSILTLDTSLVSEVPGGSTADRLKQAYDALAATSGG